MNYILASVGLILLFLGGDIYVRSLIRLADAFRISTRVSGIVIGGMGTSMPELLVCGMAAWHGHTDLVIGNVIGSNIANVLLILGIASLISTVHFSKKLLSFDAKYMLAITLLFLAFTCFGVLTLWMGVIFLVILIAYYIFVYRHEEQQKLEVHEHHENKARQLLFGSIYFVVGLGLLIWGSDLFVSYSVIIAREWGVSETVIGLTMVAIGTSLPEVATCIMAAVKKHAELVVGNVIGSNIFNILGVLGVTLFISPMQVSTSHILFDGLALLFATVLFSGLVLLNKKIGRKFSTTMLLVYVTYIFVLAPMVH